MVEWEEGKSRAREPGVDVGRHVGEPAGWRVGEGVGVVVVVGRVVVGLEGGVEGIRRDEPLLVPLAEGGLELAEAFAWEQVGVLAARAVVDVVEVGVEHSLHGGDAQAGMQWRGEGRGGGSDGRW